jgi:hypothetical protein
MQPQPDRCKLNEGEMVCREFVVVRRNPPTLFVLFEEPFYQIPGAVTIWRKQMARCLLAASFIIRHVIAITEAASLPYTVSDFLSRPAYPGRCC